MQNIYIYPIINDLIFTGGGVSPVLSQYIQRIQSFSRESAVEIISLIPLAKEQDAALQKLKEHFKIGVTALDTQAPAREFIKYILENSSGSHENIIYNFYPTLFIDPEAIEAQIHEDRSSSHSAMLFYHTFTGDTYVILNTAELASLETTPPECDPNNTIMLDVWNYFSRTFGDKVRNLNPSLHYAIYDSLGIRKSISPLQTRILNNMFILDHPLAQDHFKEILDKSGCDYAALTAEKAARTALDMESPYFIESLILELSTGSKIDNIFLPLTHLHNSVKNRPGHMDEKVLDRLIGISKNLFNVKVNFARIGDPLAHPHFIEVLKKFFNWFDSNCRTIVDNVNTSLSNSLTIYTDGIDLSDDIIDLIVKKSNVNLMLYLDGNTAGEYTALNKNDYYNRVLQNIELVCNKKRDYIKQLNDDAYNRILNVAIIRHLGDDSYEPVMDFLKQWGQFQQHVQSSLEQNDTTEDPAKERFNQAYKANIPPIEYAVIKGYSDYAGQFPAKKNPDYTPLKRFPCRRLLSSLYILTDGTVTLCDRDVTGKYAIGSIMEVDSLEELFRKSDILKYRKLHCEGKWDDIELCRNCRDWYIPVE